MLLKLKIFLYKLLITKSKIWWMLHFNPVIRAQMKNPKSIPIVIINFNQLYYLQKLVDFLVSRHFEKIVIVDNLSTYPPLLEYYKNLPRTVILERMKENYGHMVFFENTELQEKYGKGFYVVTDADIVPNENLPEDFMDMMLGILIKELNKVTKVGFALKTDDIPDDYPFKKQVLNWEKKFWKVSYPYPVKSYYAKIDTTFALYMPHYPQLFNRIDFLQGVRIAGNFTASHGGWYVDPLNMTDEQQFYQATSSNASSWLIKSDGNLDLKHSHKYSSPKN